MLTWANGKEVPGQSGGMSTNMKGITFHQEFDALPRDLQELQLQLVSFAADHDVHEQVELNINKVKKNPDGTILHTRILHFPGSGSILKLDIQRMTYEKNYDKSIDIPLN